MDIENTSLIEQLREEIEESVAIKQALFNDKTNIEYLSQIAAAICRVLRSNGRLLIAGNGGSAADSQHIAAELVGRFSIERPGLAAIALTTDTSVLTAVANDYDYQEIFARQLKALARPGDAFLALSTSGNSPNIIEALKVAQELKVTSFSFTGESGGQAKALSDYCMCVPSRNPARIQESHILMGHLLCSAIEHELYPSPPDVNICSSRTNLRAHQPSA